MQLAQQSLRDKIDALIEKENCARHSLDTHSHIDSFKFHLQYISYPQFFFVSRLFSFGTVYLYTVYLHDVFIEYVMCERRREERRWTLYSTLPHMSQMGNEIIDGICSMTEYILRTAGSDGENLTQYGAISRREYMCGMRIKTIFLLDESKRRDNETTGVLVPTLKHSRIHSTPHAVVCFRNNEK